MTNGELFWGFWCAAIQRHVGFRVMAEWSLVSAAEQAAIEEAAAEFFMKKLRDVRCNTCGGPAPMPDGRSWNIELQKYGRHLPSCVTGAPCNCGFEAIERELTATRGTM